MRGFFYHARSLLYKRIEHFEYLAFFPSFISSVVERSSFFSFFVIPAITQNAYIGAGSAGIQKSSTKNRQYECIDKIIIAP
jgi:hypothetical protein